MKHVTIIGTGLIGASIGLALRAAGFDGSIAGIDASGDELMAAQTMGAIDVAARSPEEHRAAWKAADVIVLAVPVMAILQWMQTMAPDLRDDQMVTDAGSTKVEIVRAAQRLMPQNFLPGHPMAGKESGGATLAEATLFRGATWIFNPLHEATELEAEWRQWVVKFGANAVDMDAERHDELCAWVSHMPQMVSTSTLR